ncbi:Papain-like cysteine peptidase superfamily [Arabidopsis thaliana x Arabidopsis arenosa]|uniref:Papain-like cysteine peptidase superfamily n=1 Tax=Arabidopsis thaliana x Arabidopsis arenosa TaxID=1240361 RepID=A0A8T2GTM7_9BRAS|nr:Papain-like cysteine peptidase superfamily [Arabidopsis thaliana x Arabidopsis arenosa]
MDPSNVQEVEKLEEIDPDLSLTQDDAEEPIGKLNATCVSALAMILKSIWNINVFASSREDESVFHEFLLNDLSLKHPLEANGVFDLFLNILEALPNWGLYFEVYEVAKKICNRCKLDLEYPAERSFRLIISASSLREVKSAFKDFTFENIIKVIKMNLKMPCDKEGCGKQSYVHRMITKLPSVFTIALEWTKNETAGEIFDTVSVLATEINVNVIYQCEGDIRYTKYRLVSMVCLHGNRYNCVAYENNRWVRYLRSEIEVIGDWENVVSICLKNIRPQILFFENVMQREQ